MNLTEPLINEEDAITPSLKHRKNSSVMVRVADSPGQVSEFFVIIFVEFV